MKKIKILGAGCAKCKTLAENVRKAVEEAGVEAEVEKIEGHQGDHKVQRPCHPRPRDRW